MIMDIFVIYLGTSLYFNTIPTITDRRFPWQTVHIRSAICPLNDMHEYHEFYHPGFTMSSATGMT